MRAGCIILFLLIASSAVAQQPSFRLVEPAVASSFRGLSVVDNKIAWVSGSNGWVGRTDDGGVHWTYSQVKGFEKFDFRSIYAFDAKKVIIANAGAPANILLTSDGGTTWKPVYANTDTLAFIDGIDFWNDKEGLVYGDPIKGKMLLLKTTDGGLTWNELREQSPALEQGEASFAASGTNIRCTQKSEAIIATGGSVSRIFRTNDGGSSWKQFSVPIIQGQSSTGIFSVAINNNRMIVVGGDYLKDTLTTDHTFLSDDLGSSWKAPVVATRGYRESVEFINNKVVVAVGPSGIDISYDAGQTWKAFSDEKLFHVIRKARKGNVILIAGGKGKIGRLIMQ